MQYLSDILNLTSPHPYSVVTVSRWRCSACSRRHFGPVSKDLRARVATGRPKWWMQQRGKIGQMDKMPDDSSASDGAVWHNSHYLMKSTVWTAWPWGELHAGASNGMDAITAAVLLMRMVV